MWNIDFYILPLEIKFYKLVLKIKTTDKQLNFKKKSNDWRTEICCIAIIYQTPWTNRPTEKWRKLLLYNVLKQKKITKQKQIK